MEKDHYERFGERPPMPSEIQPDLGIVLSFLRSGQGWKQAHLAKAAGISPKILSDYELGWRNLTRERLEYLVAFLGLPAAAIDATLDRLAANRALARPPLGSEPFSTAPVIEALAARVGTLAAGFARATLSMLTLEGEALIARQRAEGHWDRLKKRAPADRRSLVKHGTKFRTWALCERVAAESIQQAPNHPKESLELAELALLIAELLPTGQAWSLRMQGYAWAHVSNSLRVCNDLPGADDAIGRAWKLWEAGAPGDPGLLNEAMLPWLEAALRRDQRRFPEALKRIDEALALNTGEVRGEILLSKSAIFQILGNPEGSATALAEAAPLIDPVSQPRSAFGVRFNLLVDLCLLDKFEEAEPGLPEVQALAVRLGEELDLTRVVWLKGKVAAGLGRLSEAQPAFEQAQRVFRRRGLALNYAVISLELAALLLEQGRAAEVKTLAEEMLKIFQTQEIERESLAALRLFCDAAQQESATSELALRIVKFLHHAQHNPELSFFDMGKGAGAI
jgi:tetratricopeptide (TPR) repeat protein/transcriptional regulator with XRE-family HTH domain